MALKYIFAAPGLIIKIFYLVFQLIVLFTLPFILIYTLVGEQIFIAIMVSMGFGISVLIYKKWKLRNADPVVYDDGEAQGIDANKVDIRSWDNDSDK